MRTWQPLALLEDAHFLLKCLAQSFKEERADRQRFSDNGEPHHLGNFNGER